MNILKTCYGDLYGVTSFDTYSEGGVKSCMLREENTIHTPLGSFVPQHTANELGERGKKHRASLSFFPNGRIKSAALQHQVPIKTPLGTFEAELVTFHDDGAVNRLFPLNGSIDAYWSEQQERELAKYHEFDLPVGKFTTKVIALHFYPSGALKSLTLWPGEKITIRTPLGSMPVRAGFSLYEDGSVKSVEPALPLEIDTPIGPISAFDPDIIGMHADQNSVQFGPDGTLLSIKSLKTGVAAFGPDGSATRLEPLELESLLDTTETRIVPLKIDFLATEIRVTGLRTSSFSRADYRFTTFPVDVTLTAGCSGGCDGLEEAVQGCGSCDGACETTGMCANCDGSCGEKCPFNRG